MLRRLARPRNFVLIGTGTAIGAAYYQNDYSLSDIGLFRFMRAGFTVSLAFICTYWIYFDLLGYSDGH
jgi:hypothetical protein